MVSVCEAPWERISRDYVKPFPIIVSPWLFSRSSSNHCTNPCPKFQKINIESLTISHQKGHRIIELLRLEGSSVVILSKPLAQAGPPMTSCPGLCTYSFCEYRGWRLHIISGQPVLLLSHPHSKTVFPDVQKEPAVFQCVPIAFCPGTKKSLAPSSSQPHFRYLYTLLKSLQSLLQAEQA